MLNEKSIHLTQKDINLHLYLQMKSWTFSTIPYQPHGKRDDSTRKNYADSTIKEMTNIFETRVKNIASKEEREKSSAPAKKPKDKLLIKKRRQEDPNSSVVESSQDASLKHRPFKTYCIIHGKCSHTMDKNKDMRAMINKHK